MSNALLPLILLSSVVGGPAIEPGARLTFRGTFEATKGDPAESRKEFDLILFGERTPDGENRLRWVVAEQGRGAWPWTDRFGVYSAESEPNGIPSLLYDREDGPRVVPLLPADLLKLGPLQAGREWERDGLSYRVAADETVGRPAWKVRVESPYGHKRTVWLDRQFGTPLELREDVVLGQGEHHRLRWQWVENEQLSPERTTATLAVLDQLADLRQRLQVEPRTRSVRWSPEQLAVLRRTLPPLAEGSHDAAVAGVLAAAVTDTKEQRGRDGAIKAVKKNLLGKPLPALPLTDLQGERFVPKGQRVTVLHFWDYKDKPLVEPYGQVGYIDFLARQRAGEGVDVYGVVVNPKLADGGERGRVIASAKKLKSFMRLSYPLLLDSGAAIKELGDPRVSGGKLPLVVVIDSKGKVAHYHTGFYEVDRQRGLAVLDDVVRESK